MTNEQAIKILDELARSCGYEVDINSKDVEALNKAIKVLKNERPKGEWIPVSEKLPEEEGDYLLWGKIDESEEEDYPFIGNYDAGCEQFGIWQEQFDRHTLGYVGCEFFAFSRVVAWQPLPRPYKEADNG